MQTPFPTIQKQKYDHQVKYLSEKFYEQAFGHDSVVRQCIEEHFDQMKAEQSTRTSSASSAFAASSSEKPAPEEPELKLQGEKDQTDAPTGKLEQTQKLDLQPKETKPSMVSLVKKTVLRMICPQKGIFAGVFAVSFMIIVTLLFSTIGLFFRLGLTTPDPVNQALTYKVIQNMYSPFYNFAWPVPNWTGKLPIGSIHNMVFDETKMFKNLSQVLYDQTLRNLSHPMKKNQWKKAYQFQRNEP